MQDGIDFETYSEAGLRFNKTKNRWEGVAPNKRGLAAVGAWAYSEHETTEVICLYYRLGGVLYRWTPFDPPPWSLFRHIAAGGLLGAFNSFFEFSIWSNVCVPRYGWPPLNITQLRCSAARARKFSLPGKLEKVTAILRSAPKDLEGHKVMLKISVPRNPTKNDDRLRIRYEDDPELYHRTYDYCGGDVLAEAGVAELCPELSPEELEVWQYDQIINARGVAINTDALEDCLAVVDLATAHYTKELAALTGGKVTKASQGARLIEFVNARQILATGRPGNYLGDLQADTVDAALERDDLDPTAYRALEIRSLIGSASVKKLAAMKARLGRDGRLRDLFVYAGAVRTSRWSGAAVQPQNLPNKSPDVVQCTGCGLPRWDQLPYCPACLCPVSRVAEWGPEAIALAFKHIKTRDLEFLEQYWGSAILLVIGVIRSLFVPRPGYRFIGADFSAIEAVVLAWLAGEEWRLEVFRTHGKIYEMSAALITGVPFEEIVQYKEQTGVDHPLRKKVGKIAELASGYRGSVEAWKHFGADKFMTDDEIQDSVFKWRAASPMIVAFWDGLEAAAMNAIENPGTVHSYRLVSYWVETHRGIGPVLHCRVPSGQELYYFNPAIEPALMPWKDRRGGDVWRPNICFMGWDSLSQSWVKIRTHGGKLCENVTQKTARDLQAAGVVNAERSGYPVVLHVHDEIVTEVPIGSRHSLEEFEGIMSRRPDWGRDIPIRASGYEGAFYHKG